MKKIVGKDKDTISTDRPSVSDSGINRNHLPLDQVQNEDSSTNL